MNDTATEAFTDADALEDSALLAALEVKSGNVHAPDGARLVAQGLATVDEERGHYFLTDDGRAAAEALRERERLIIPDEYLDVVLSLAGRAHSKASGWIAGFTLMGRPYIERVRLPHTSPEQFHQANHTGSTWVNIPFQIFSKLGGYAEQDGARIYFAPEFRPSWAPEPEHTIPGTPFPLDRDAVSAVGHADAVWADLCDQSPGAPFRTAVIDADGPRDEYRPPVAWIFHYFSRDVRLDLDDHGRYRATVTDAPDAGWATPNPPAVWTGHRADVAVKAMARALYGTRCSHDYGTGRDSCPGCDHTAELFEDRYPLRGYGMRSLILH
jgi:hypothetical protein